MEWAERPFEAQKAPDVLEEQGKGEPDAPARPTAEVDERGGEDDGEEVEKSIISELPRGWATGGCVMKHLERAYIENKRKKKQKTRRNDL